MDLKELHAESPHPKWEGDFFEEQTDSWPLKWNSLTYESNFRGPLQMVGPAVVCAHGLGGAERLRAAGMCAARSLVAGLGPGVRTAGSASGGRCRLQEDPEALQCSLGIREAAGGREGLRCDGQLHFAAAFEVLGHDLQQRAGVDAGPAVLADGYRETGGRDGPDKYCRRPGVEADCGRDDCLANWQRDSLVLVLVLFGGATGRAVPYDRRSIGLACRMDGGVSDWRSFRLAGFRCSVPAYEFKGSRGGGTRTTWVGAVV